MFEKIENINGKQLVSEKRKYLVKNVAEAKKISQNWVKEIDLVQAVSFGLPEIDDRYHIWRVPITKKNGKNKIGEIVIDAYTTEVLLDKTTKQEMLEARLLGKDEEKIQQKKLKE